MVTYGISQYINGEWVYLSAISFSEFNASEYLHQIKKTMTEAPNQIFVVSQDDETILAINLSIGPVRIDKAKS